MPIQGQKFVIVGGAGFVGSALAHTLIVAHSGDVIICDSFGGIDQNKWANLPAAIDDLWAQQTLLPNLDKAWRDIAGVILLADTKQDSQDGDALFEAAYHLPRRVWDFCVAKQRPLYWASSAHVYGEGQSQLSRDVADVVALKPISAFGRAKLAFDVFAARQGTGPNTPPAWASWRLSSAYGKGEAHKGEFASLPVRAMAAAKAGNALGIWEDSMEATRDWVHVDDAAAAIAALTVGEHAGFFDIGSGVMTTTRNLISHVGNLSGTALRLRSLAAPVSSIKSIASANIAALGAVGVPVQFRTLQQGLTAL
jgi:nucleoside-diphosphate-sugar epimerase